MARVEKCTRVIYGCDVVGQKCLFGIVNARRLQMTPLLAWKVTIYTGSKEKQSGNNVNAAPSFFALHLPIEI